MPTLDELSPGHCGRVLSIQGEPDLIQRLLDFGLVEGEELEVVGIAPLGDPMEIRCGSSRFSLRRRDAAGIEIREIE